MASPFIRGSRTSSSLPTSRTRWQQNTHQQEQQCTSTLTLQQKPRDLRSASISTTAQAGTPSAERTAKPGNLQLDDPTSLSFERDLITHVYQLSHIATNLVSELDKLRQRLTQANPNGFTTIGGGCAEKSAINPVQAVQAMHLRNNSYDSSGSGPRLRT